MNVKNKMMKYVLLNWLKGMPSGSIACTRKQQSRFYWSCSSVLMNAATTLTPPSAWAGFVRTNIHSIRYIEKYWGRHTYTMYLVYKWAHASMQTPLIAKLTMALHILSSRLWWFDKHSDKKTDMHRQHNGKSFKSQFNQEIWRLLKSMHRPTTA